MKKYLAILSILAVSIFYFITKETPSSAKVPIGIIIPLSKEVASAGEAVKNAIEINTHTNIRSLYEDDACDGKQAISAYNKLKSEGVHVFYIACSGSVLSVAPLAKRDGNLILTAFAGSDKIRESGDETIRFIPDGMSIVDKLAPYIEQNVVDKNLLSVVYENKDYPNSVLNSLEKATNATLNKFAYNATDKNINTLVLKLKKENMKTLVIIPVTESTFTELLTAMDRLSYHPNIIGEVNVCDYKNNLIVNKFNLICFQAKLIDSKAESYLKRYKSYYKVDPKFAFYQAATTDVFSIIDAIAQDHQDSNSIKKELLNGQKGEYGSYYFNAVGELTNVGDYLQLVTNKK